MSYRQSKSRNHIAVAEMQLNYLSFVRRSVNENAPAVKGKVIAYATLDRRKEADMELTLFCVSVYPPLVERQKIHYQKEI